MTLIGLTSCAKDLSQSVQDLNIYQPSTLKLQKSQPIQTEEGVYTPQKNEVIIEGKRGLCGFHSTNLGFILRSKGIKNIAIGGFLTNCCVESTMRTAYENGYNVITLTDCCAGLSLEEHKNAIEKDFPMFSQPMTSLEFMKIVKGQDELVLKGKGYE